eukprot:984381-Lingulodinium_polyedra.AAC.1
MAFTVVCGLAGYIPDAALKLMLRDSRAAAQVGLWEEAAQGEFSLLATWGLSVWQGICARGLAGTMPARALQDK